MYKLPERRGGGVIRAMPERKHSFFRRCSLTLSINLPFSRVFPVDRRIGDLSSLLHVVLQILQKMCQEPQQQTLFAIQTNLAVVHFCHILIS